ncbi:5'-nucleotidase C-terminal domain-containing protein [Planobispora takensis]|uniref:5'-nucleotidase C-terminal domain-containing protein n=1 Tax=Planobispora takensis TaxID=1367882 RepID=UPI001941E6C5|nr:5'-nucleotidase C-terminal domain-containing protein [Planobispora takensis]
MTLSTTVKIKAPATLKYTWIFSDGDQSKVKTYRVGGKGLKTIALSTSVKVTDDTRGWGAVRLFSPVRKTSGKASFAVTCAEGGKSTGDAWDTVGGSVVEIGARDNRTTPSPKQADDKPASPKPAEDNPAQNPVQKARIAFERTTASKCPLTFKVHGYFEGLPAGAQTVQYRFAGTQAWKTVDVPADHGAVFSTVLETFEWGWETEENSVQIEVNQPNGLTSNIIYYFECRPPISGTNIGVAAEDIALTSSGGPVAELVADAMLEAVQSVSGAQTALVSKYGMHEGLEAGPVTSSDVWGIQSAGLAIDVWEVTGAQLKKILVPNDSKAGVLTPSASLSYTLAGGVVTDLKLNGAPVSDTQVIKVAANYILAGGWQGFPRWDGVKSVSRSGPDDTGALASYIANHSPIRAPKGERVTVR